MMKASRLSRFIENRNYDDRLARELIHGTGWMIFLPSVNPSSFCIGFSDGKERWILLKSREQCLLKSVLLALSTLLFFSCSTPETNQQDNQATKPNILLIIADDMGYADLGCFGGKANTPNLDELAQNGIKFTNFYAAAPNCSPSRAGLMTGISPSILGMYNYRPPKHPMHLLDKEVTIAEMLHEQGYQTGHFGKWHLGALADEEFDHPQPIDQGFSYSLGTENNAQPSHLNPVNFIRNGVKIRELKGYSCQLVANEAISWLDTIYREDNPFFMYVAFHEPHAKVASPPELVAKYPEFPPKDAEYLANIENLDLAVGKLLTRLKANNQFDNTLIIFSSDNGSYRQASNGALKAKKSFVYEGGIRVPGIINWTNKLQSGQTIEEAAGFVDIFPTLAEIVNAKVESKERLDGTSIWPLLKGEDFKREKPLYWFFYRTTPEMALRTDNKVVLGFSDDTLTLSHQFVSPDMDYIRNMRFTRYELYDLEEDISQQKNIFQSDNEAQNFQKSIEQQLNQIQERGHYWKKLPPDKPAKQKKQKKDWVRLK